MRGSVLVVLVGLLSGLGCGGDDGGGGGGEADAAEETADAPGVPDGAPLADAGDTGDAQPRVDSPPRDGAGLMCGDKPLYEDCLDGTECSSCLCFSLDGDNAYCSKSCTGDDGCPEPSQGCSLISGGFCLPPP